MAGNKMTTVEVWPWDGGDVVAIDWLVLFMSITSTWHAVAHGKVALLLASLALGALTEAGAIRCGGTHCHNAGLLNFAYCSSANSVVYYMPWIYCCVVSATRLVGHSRWALPWVCGALTFGMCGVYEMQGPNLRWWKWPVVPGDTSGKGGWIVAIDNAALTGIDHLFGYFWQLHAREGHVISDHAADALAERVWSLDAPIERPALPVMAPYFDMAFGWGIGLMLWLTPSLGEMACVLLGAGAALMWDLPVRLLRYFGYPQVATVPVLMALALAIPALMPRGLCRRPASMPKDWLLFVTQLANAGFFCHNALTAGVDERGVRLIPSSLAALILTVATGALTAHAIASGILLSDPPPTTSAEVAKSSGRQRSPKRTNSSPKRTTSPKALRRSPREVTRRSTTASASAASSACSASASSSASSASSASASASASAPGRRSWLDNLQKDAQASELEPANTAPSTFLLLTVGQTVVSQSVSK